LQGGARYDQKKLRAFGCWFFLVKNHQMLVAHEFQAKDQGLRAKGQELKAKSQKLISL
jgi:hypothetical protein